MGGYTKLFSSIVHSTVWRAPDHVRLVWITMLALADRDGCVEASVPGLSDAARVTLAQCEEALGVLLAPDKYSRTPDYEGRRIEAISGGWELLNYQAYRERSSKEQARQKANERQKRYRNRLKNDGALRSVTHGDALSRDVTPGDPIAEAEAEAEEKAGSSLRSDSVRASPGPPMLSDFERLERAVVAKRKSVGKAWRRGTRDYDPVVAASEAVRAQADDEGADFDAVLSECLDGWAGTGWVRDKGYPVGSFLTDPLKSRGLVDGPRETDADAAADRKDALRRTREKVDAARRALASGPDPSDDPVGHGQLVGALDAAEAAHGANAGGRS